MSSKRLWLFVSLLIVASLAFAACQPAAPATQQPQPQEEQPAAEEPAAEEPAAEEPAAEEPAAEDALIFGMLLVGPYNDHGYSEAHYNGGLYVEEHLDGAQMLYIDKVNTADRPGTTPAQLAEDLVSKGAKVVIFNSDDMKDSAIEFAQNHPDIWTIHASGDSAWAEGKDFKNLPNMVAPMGRMEYGKMIAGCAAALTTQTGQIGYLGPLINDETRRLAASAFLGARYCWEEYLGNDPADLQFRVNWIGFWFNIPGVTSDPTQVADDFYNSGFDVVISGIDTTEALVEAKKFSDAGQDVWAIPYDYEGACDEGPEVCLGVPYFNWGPAYLEYLTAFKEGTLETGWHWLSPDWSDINNPDTSAVGFIKGDALSEEASAEVDRFIEELGQGLNLWTGPIVLQDGTEYIPAGQEATDFDVWYLPQLLEGMEGQSVAE